MITPETEPKCGQVFGDCPRAFRYFLAPDDAPSVYAAAKAIVQAAGFVIEEETRPHCNADPPRTPACGLIAIRDKTQVQVRPSIPGRTPMTSAPLHQAGCRSG